MKLDCENEWFVLSVEDLPQHSCRDTFLQMKHIITHEQLEAGGFIWTCLCGNQIPVEIEVEVVSEDEAVDGNE